MNVEKEAFCFFLHYNYTTIFYNLAKNLYMIQRIQTIYLAIAAICILLTFFIPFSTYSILDEKEIFNASGFSFVDSTITLFPVIFNVGASVILSFLAIMSFKNRKRQLQLNMINYLSIVVLLVFVFVDFDKIEGGMKLEEEQIHYGVGMFLPIVSLVCVFLANRSIKSDEKLIKSMDRIR